MNTLKNLLVGVVIGGVVVALGFVFFGGDKALNLGAISVPAQATTTHQTALSNEKLYGWQFNVVDSLRNIRDSVSYVQATSNVAFATTFVDSNATTSMSGWSGLSYGDLCDIRVTSGTTQVAQLGLIFRCDVTASTTVLASVFVPGRQATSTANTTYHVNVKVMKNSLFGNPAALDVSTSSTPGVD